MRIKEKTTDPYEKSQQPQGMLMTSPTLLDEMPYTGRWKGLVWSVKWAFHQNPTGMDA